MLQGLGTGTTMSHVFVLYFQGPMGEVPIPCAALHKNVEVQQPLGTAKWKKNAKVFIGLQGII